MKVLAVLCLAVALAQAIEMDWDNLIDLEVQPGLMTEILAQGVPDIPVFDDDDVEIERITNGLEAESGQFPYQVGLLIATPLGNGFCGGSILNEEWILTAAHCVDVATDVEVVAGAHNIRVVENGQVRISNNKIIVHEAWNNRTIKDDVALIKLSEKLTFNALIQPIRLPSRSQVRETFAHRTGTVSGWGRTSDSSNAISTTLQWVSNPISTNANCNLFYFGSIQSNQICLAARGGRSSCNGDSGGPLVVFDTDGDRTLVGVVSHGIALGCTSGWPGVYARTSSYLDWIAAKTDLVV